MGAAREIHPASGTEYAYFRKRCRSWYYVEPGIPLTAPYQALMYNGFRPDSSSSPVGLAGDSYSVLVLGVF